MLPQELHARSQVRTSRALIASGSMLWEGAVKFLACTLYSTPVVQSSLLSQDFSTSFLQYVGQLELMTLRRGSTPSRF